MLKKYHNKTYLTKAFGIEKKVKKHYFNKNKESKQILLFVLAVKITSRIAPERASGTLTCSNGKIKVFSAFYGRMSYETLKLNPMLTDDCFLDVLAKIAPM